MNAELKEIVGGAVQERFNHSFEKVIENLLDENTPFKNKREINIKIKFTQNETRDDVRAEILVSEKLAPQGTLSTSFAIGKDLKTGKVFADEYGKQLRGQISVDTETGEILSDESPDEAQTDVIDFRKAKGE